MDDFDPRLQRCPLFEGLDPEDLPALLRCAGAHRQSYPRGGQILTQGDVTRELGILLSGTATIERTDYWGNRALVEKLEAGDAFAESYVFAGDEPLRVSVTAAEACQALWMDGAMLLKTCEKACAFHHQILMNLTRFIAGKNLLLSRKIALLSRRSTRDKLLSYLSEQALTKGSDSFSIPFSRQELADYLCVERSAMSATLSRLKREGAIDYHRNQFRILGGGE